ncbi:MAG: hypothetical protein NTY74_13865 [Ignavibacteriae bacterium]|nr:hypothetical protein [Ignavibacteriota bacterium]
MSYVNNIKNKKHRTSVYTLLLIILISTVLYSCSNKRSADDEYKKASEDARINKQNVDKSNNEYNDVKSKYKYLENRKIKSKRDFEKFVDEIKGLGFVLVDQKRKLNTYGPSSTDFELEKSEGKFTIHLLIAEFDDGDHLITVY